ncbi:uncharacterized protein LOC121793060 isoform X2 [Salvia splendens]|nr:uncharacterized protein LOC121793060 isoform X2 [Salvia splendens]
MTSNMEIVSVTRQKQDPAWKHCEMLRNGGKVEIKCIYCGKIFKGGGIHRFKEHLACQKGNGATCSSVHPDVRLEMIQILSRTKKRPRLAKDKDKPACDSPGNSRSAVPNNSDGDIHVHAYDNPRIGAVELANNSGCLNSNHNTAACWDREDGMSWDREDGVSGKTNIKKKRETVATKALDVVNSNTAAFPALNLKKKVSIVDMAVGRFFFDVGLPADAVNSAYFQPMLDAIASQGTGVVGPSYHDLRSCILKNAVHEVRYDVDQCTAALGKTGCSILLYDSSSGKCKTFVNLFASSSEGTIFLRSADISCAIDSADALYELLKETVEEIGLRNVVQVVTTGEERNAIAGRRLAETYPSIFWTPCAGYCIDLMLQDIGELPMVKMILDQAKSISRYIYSNATTINMIRRYTSGVDLVDLGTTRSSSDFMTLKRMVNVRPNLQSMVTSEEWMESSYSKKEEGFALLDSICDQSFWSTCASITRLIDPILHLLRIVSSQKMPSMGSIYAGLYRVKDAIKKELVTRESYLVYWSIIDHRWEQLQRHPLHAAGFYLNPRHFYSLERDGYLHIRSLVYDCIEKLVPEPNIQDKIMRETTSYHSATGDFGRKMAIRARDTILPTEWWLTYGGECPNLARLAIRILSQTCCLIQHKVDKVSLERMHAGKNWLEHQRLSDLVYVQNNMSLKHMSSGERQEKAFDPLSYEHINLVEDWVMGNEFCSEDSEKKGWVDVEPPYGNVMESGLQINDVEAHGAGFDDYEILFGVKDSEEETGGENIHTGNTGDETIVPGGSARWSLN